MPGSEYKFSIATDDDFEAMATFDGRAFGDVWKPEELAAVRPLLDLDRFHLVRFKGELVGVAGTFSQELTVPGGTVLPAGGVTWVAVAPTHRRRGLLTKLMDRVHRDIDDHDEPIAMLTASEGGIYERFGYGVATQWRVGRVDRRHVQVRPEFQPAPGDVELVNRHDSRVVKIFDRYRRQRVGEISRSAEYFESQRVGRGDGTVIAVHADGFAAWKVSAAWHDGHPAHEMRLLDLIAITPEAHAALWHTVLSLDLVGPIETHNSIAADDELPYLVTDQRGVRTTNLNDMLWVHLRDVKRALKSRVYGSDDSFVVELSDIDGGQRWKVDGDVDGASVTKVRTRPDIVTDRASLGAMYLGGVRPSTLARGRRLTAKNTDVLRRADHFFAADRLPHCTTGF